MFLSYGDSRATGRLLAVMPAHPGPPAPTHLERSSIGSVFCPVASPAGLPTVRESTLQRWDAEGSWDADGGVRLFVPGGQDG